MAPIELGIRCPQNVNGITADPQPDWSFENLLSELDSIDKKLNLRLDFPPPFTKTQPRDVRRSRDKNSCGRRFVMHVSDDESSCTGSDSADEADNKPVVSGKRFACDELYMSDDSKDAMPLGVQCDLMDKVGLAEAALVELAHDLQLTVPEEVRSKISCLKTALVNENGRFASLTTKIDKYRELQQQRERKFDLQYQRTIAEALDNHLTAVQRDHKHMSQLEERRIRDDVAREEAKRREKAMQEEKLQQERVRAEEEARLKVEMAERAKAAATEAEKKAAEEAASAPLNTAHEAVEDSNKAVGASTSSFDVKKRVQSSARNMIKASENALELEKRRCQIYEELTAQRKALKESANQDYRIHGKNFLRQIKTITASIENVSTKAEELVKLINTPGCPQSISILLFAKKMVSNCTNQRSSDVFFAISRVIVLVTSKIPVAMDILIAKLNKVCIYTVPKHISYSKEAFRTRDAYFKAIGFTKENGKIESIDDYLERLSCYMKLYGALVQTEAGNFKNVHGITQGWAWLARFLNALPANLYTAVALDSFLQMAGHALYRRCKHQFEKLVRIIGRDFLDALKEEGNSKVVRVRTSIQNYIESKEFMRQPEGLQLRGHLESSHFC